MAYNFNPFTGRLDFVEKLHNNLESIQGGAVGDYYHFTLAEKNSSLNQVPYRNVDISLVNLATITLADTAKTNIMVKISGNGGAVATSAISNGTVNGQRLILIGSSNTNTVTLNPGANVTMNGSCILAQDDIIEFIWDNTAVMWYETSRRA